MFPPSSWALNTRNVQCSNTRTSLIQIPQKCNLVWAVERTDDWRTSWASNVLPFLLILINNNKINKRLDVVLYFCQFWADSFSQYPVLYMKWFRGTFPFFLQPCKVTIMSGFCCCNSIVNHVFWSSMWSFSMFCRRCATLRSVLKRITTIWAFF